jgi:hypothetical protein
MKKYSKHKDIYGNKLYEGDTCVIKGDIFKPLPLVVTRCKEINDWFLSINRDYNCGLWSWNDLIKIN